MQFVDKLVHDSPLPAPHQSMLDTHGYNRHCLLKTNMKCSTTQKGQELEEEVISLTENTNVKVLELLSYTRVDLLTLSKVNCNDTNFTTILLLWEGGGVRRGVE